MADHNDVGKWGERVARDYLLTHGYTIAGENVRIGNVEIDLVALKDSSICFVEVKTRSDSFKDPADAVDSRKRQRMARAAESYVRAFDIRHDPQFDIIIVVGNPMHFTIEHIPDAFFPTLGNSR